jgi:hypothetical protein
MRPHPRIRKTVKWGGAVVTVLLVVVWIGSGWISRTWCFRSGRTLVVEAGELWCIYPLKSSFQLTPEEIEMLEGNNGWHSFRFFWSPQWDRNKVTTRVNCPLWIPILITILPTAIAWRLDALARRRERAARLNLCPKCNYDRAGLAKGAVCPECGSKGEPP